MYTTMEAIYTFHIKNMVCQRCVLIVRNILSSLQIGYAAVSMGKITLDQKLESARQKQLADELRGVGLDIVEGRKNQLIEDTKTAVLDYIALGVDVQQYKLSAFIASRLSYEFGYISDLFSKVEGITIERYFILQRLEKVKELLLHDELSLSQISYETGFSSVHHLSAQFKKLTGMTPSQYKNQSQKDRQAIDMIGVQ